MNTRRKKHRDMVEQMASPYTTILSRSVQIVTEITPVLLQMKKELKMFCLKNVEQTPGRRRVKRTILIK